MFYSASQRVQRAITLCGMWVSENELLITGSQDHIPSAEPIKAQTGNTILHCICVIVKLHESDSIDCSDSPEGILLRFNPNGNQFTFYTEFEA